MAAILISHRVTMGKISNADKLQNCKVYCNHNALEKFSIRWGCHVTEIYFEDQLPFVMAAILKFTIEPYGKNSNLNNSRTIGRRGLKPSPNVLEGPFKFNLKYRLLFYYYFYIFFFTNYYY